MEARRNTRRTFPGQRTLLAWLFGLRVLLAVGGVLAALLTRGDEGTNESALIVTTAALLAFIITPYGYWLVWTRGRQPGLVFYSLQVAVDLILVTTIVHYTSGAQSAFTFLYVLMIAAYTTLLPLRGAVLVVILSALTYGGDTLLGHPDTMGVAFWGQLVLFLSVFAIMGPMVARLRQATEEHETLETELRRIKLEADDILRNIRSGVLTVDGTGRLAFINPMAAKLLEVDSETQVGMPVLDLLKQRSPELWAAIVAAIRHGRKVNRAEGSVLLADGRMFPIGLSTTTFEGQVQQPPSVTAIFTDISDSKRIQELHLRAERLEAVAALSASLAHEIRNPLASIRSSVEQLARSARADDDDRFLAQLIVRESDRLSRLLSEFLDFSRVRVTRFDPVDLHGVALAAARLVREHPDAGKETEIDVRGGRAMMEGDEDLLHRVVANLLLNAVQAGGGKVKIVATTGPAHMSDLPPGCLMTNPVRLEIRDNGPGIPDTVRDRIFEPFVTGRTGGTGLGLAIVQRAVEAHRGLVLVETVPARGTTFTIFFPARWSTEEAA
ncbi:MAG TPA: ATP-binding protein [Gemmatimonadales bacterium]|nr:ATP-binding protein [Gemmatimonadales bacterium]